MIKSFLAVLMFVVLGLYMIHLCSPIKTGDSNESQRPSDAVEHKVAKVALPQEESRDAAAADNITDSEEKLLQAFPQLLWSRTNLEFMFEARAKIYAGLQAGESSDALAVKMAAEMEKRFPSSEDQKRFTEGWKMSGKIHEQTSNFSKAACMLNGIPFETELLFYGSRLSTLSFWTDNDKDFAALYALLVGACGSPGDRHVSGKLDAQINWTILGGAQRYDVELSRRDDERGVTFAMKHL
jgi:hypothetical protein